MEVKYKVILTIVRMENHAEWMRSSHYITHPKDQSYTFADVVFTSLSLHRYQEANGRDMIEEEWQSSVSFEELEKLVDAMDYTPSDTDVDDEKINLREQCECWDDAGREHWLAISPIEFIEPQYRLLLQRLAKAMSKVD